MKQYIDPPLGGMAYLYGSNADASVSSRFVATLTMHLRTMILEQALNEAVRRFPQVAVTVGEVDGEYVLIPVDAPVRVFDIKDADQPYLFGDPALSGYLFKVSVSHKTICFDFSRALVDVHGLMAFVKAVIYRYLELAGYPVSSDGTVKLLSGSYFPAEGDDPLPRMEDMNASRPVWYMDAKAVNAPVKDCVREDVVQIRIPQSKLKGDRMQLVNIPVTYLAPVFSHAVSEALADVISPGEYVVASVQINLRPYVPSASIRPYTTPVFLVYNRNLDEYPFTTVLMSQKKLLEAQLKNDTLAYSAQRRISDIEKAFDRKKSLEERKAGASALLAKTASMSTYDVCRVGNVILPDAMQRYVTEFYPVIPSGTCMFSLTVISYRGDVIVTVSGRNDVAKVCGRFVELLNKYDMDAFIADEFSFIPMDNMK